MPMRGQRRTGVKRMHHPVVGDLELTYEAMELPSDPGLTMFAFLSEPGYRLRYALALLASWVATQRAWMPCRTTVSATKCERRKTG